MIDWFNLASNTLWIVALALALATLSYASWQASWLKVSFRSVVDGFGIQVALHIAGLLFCLGLAASSTPIWQVILWLLLALGFIVQLFFLLRARKASPSK